MRLSIAAGILAQTLPAVSETKISALLNSEHGRKLQFEDIVRRASRAAESGGAQKQRRVKSRAGTRTGRVNEKTAESSRSGVLKNAPLVPTSSGDLVVCDPSSSDADVGVLSCGTGRVCKRSQDSVLGGICVTKKELSVKNGLDPWAQAAAQAAKNKKRAKSTEKSSSEKLKNKSRRSSTPSSTSTRTGSKTECDPLSTDADVGVLSCGTGHYCKPQKSSQLGGECTDNRRPGGARNPRAGFGNRGASKKFLENRVQSERVECDPSSADVGILSCGPGESCVDDQGSQAGGFCVNPNPTARRLIHLTDDIGLCDPTSDDYGKYSCDCSAFDSTTKTGIVSCRLAEEICFGNFYYGCYDTCGAVSVTYDFGNSTLTSVKYCYDFVTPTTVSLCVTYNDDFATCETEYNGESCSSCDITGLYNVNFNCSNAGGPPSSSGKPRGSAEIIEACYKPVNNGEYCSLCDYNSYIPEKNNDLPVFLRGFGATTCYGLAVASNFSQISKEKCSEASAVAKSTCCAYFCDLCGVTGLIPPRNYEIAVTVPGLNETTCGELANAAYDDFSLSKDVCPSVSEAAAGVCCESFCELCTTTRIPPNRDDIPISVPGFEDITTCGDLDGAAYMSLTIPDESCPALAVIAENSCCLYRCDLCGPSGMVTFENYENIVSLPGLGEVTCGELEYAAYRNNTFDSEACPLIGVYVREACCSAFDPTYCQVCGPDGLIPYAYDENIASIPDIGDVTCYDIFLAGYYGESPLKANCSVISEVAQESCCRQIYTSCDVCGPYSAIPYENDDLIVSVPGVGNSTCYSLYYDAYLNGTVDNETCRDLVEVGRERCCESLYFDTCYLCGVGLNVSDTNANITSPDSEQSSTCGVLEYYALIGYFDDSDCAYFTSLAAQPCCGFIPSSSPAPTEDPSQAPVPPAGSAAGMPTKLGSVRTIASVATLAAATCLWLAT